MPAIEKPTKEKPTKPVGLSLYDVSETGDGKFEVILPGLYDPKRELIMGTTRKRFDTREEADAVAVKGREEGRIFAEKRSLEKTFGRVMYRIDERSDGKFRVALPSAIDSRLGVSLGVVHQDFDSWEEAKTYFLKERENEERLTKKPLLEIQTGQEKLAFSDFDAFDPKVAPSEKALDIPPTVAKYVLKPEKIAGSHPSASTYQETIKEPDWERKAFSFVSDYLQKEGAELMQGLSIKSLDALTPKQAIELTTRIVVSLTKYKTSDTIKAQGEAHSVVGRKSESDQKTALQLLQEGLRRRNDPTWEGNGVCRNFASMTKVVFEALKANQTRFSQLRDTYALYEADNESYKPKRGNSNVTKTESGHAWNSFVTVLKSGAADATIVDTTWAKRNLDTKKLEGVDYTLTRMEPMVHEIGKDLPKDAPDKEDRLRHVLSYYILKADKLGGTGGFASPEEERQFYLTRALELMRRQGAVKDLPEGFVQALGEEAEKIADDMEPGELETLWHLAKSNKGLPIQAILRGYLKDKQLSDYHATNLMVADDDLQREIFEQIKSRKGIADLMKESGKFRARIREVVPQLFIDFAPGTKTEDALELQYLIGRAQNLRGYERFVDVRKPSQDRIDAFFAKAREELRKLNPQGYDERVAALDNHALVKRYDQLYRELKK